MKDGLGLSTLDYKWLMFRQRLNNFLSSKMNFVFYTYYFGIDHTVELHKVKNNRMEWLNQCYDIICDEFKEFISSYKFLAPKQDKADSEYVWVCWLQGEDNMPLIVKECIQSIRTNIPQSKKLVLLTADNLREYLDFPDYVYRRLKKGKITLTHFSDIIRMGLLKTYGGLWIDSTVFTSSSIPEEYFDKELYSIQHKSVSQRNEDLYYGGITSFLLGGKISCALFDFCYNFFLEYQKKYDYLIDVHLINIAYRIAYERINGIKECVDHIGVNNSNVQNMAKILNDVYDEKKWVEVTNNQIFHKLNWRINYSAGDNNTFFYYLMHIKNN